MSRIEGCNAQIIHYSQLFTQKYNCQCRSNKTVSTLLVNMNMLRVSHIDSEELDTELYELIWTKFKSIIPLVRNQEEWRFFVDTLVFLFSSHYSSFGGGITTTYGSHLSNLGFTCHKVSLYLLSVFKRYFNNKLSNRCSSSLLYKRIRTIINLLDLINFVHFIRNSNTKYYTILHRILKVQPVNLDTGSSFYRNSIYSGLEYQNKQLLWNTTLELLNITILPSTTQYFNYFRRKNSISTTNSSTSKHVVCCLCNELPTNPYRIQCCQGIYCYLCLLKCIEWRHCYKCNESDNLKGISYFES